MTLSGSADELTSLQTVRQRIESYGYRTNLIMHDAHISLPGRARVTVDGVLAELGASADPETQTIAVDGRPIAAEVREYWLLNKPAGVLSAVTDARGRRTVTDLVPTRARVFPVGRLDLDSTGLVLLTNDGDLAGRLLHPRFHVEKEYIVIVRGAVKKESIEGLRRGMMLDDGLTAPAQVDFLEKGRPEGGGLQTVLKIVLHEGRKRQVRRMMEAVGHRVVSLHRARFATLTLLVPALLIGA